MHKFISPLPTGVTSNVHEALWSSPLNCDAVSLKNMTQSKRYALALAAHMPMIFEDGPDEFVTLTSDRPYLIQDYYDDLGSSYPYEVPVEIYHPLQLRFKFNATLDPLADIIPNWIELPVGNDLLLRWNVFDEKIFVTTTKEVLDDGDFPTPTELKELQRALLLSKKLKGEACFEDGTKLVTQEAVSIHELDVHQIRALKDLHIEFNDQIKSLKVGTINVETQSVKESDEILPMAIDFELLDLRVSAWTHKGKLTVEAKRFERHEMNHIQFIYESGTSITPDEAYDLLDMLQSYDFSGMWIDADSVVNTLENYLFELSMENERSPDEADEI